MKVGRELGSCWHSVSPGSNSAGGWRYMHRFFSIMSSNHLFLLKRICITFTVVCKEKSLVDRLVQLPTQNRGERIPHWCDLKDTRSRSSRRNGTECVPGRASWLSFGTWDCWDLGKRIQCLSQVTLSLNGFTFGSTCELIDCNQENNKLLHREIS